MFWKKFKKSRKGVVIDLLVTPGVHHIVDGTLKAMTYSLKKPIWVIKFRSALGRFPLLVQMSQNDLMLTKYTICVRLDLQSHSEPKNCHKIQINSEIIITLLWSLKMNGVVFESTPNCSKYVKCAR